MGIFWPFFMVISMTRTVPFSKITFAESGAAFRMCFAKAFGI